MDHQVGISFFLMEATALYQSMELVGLKPSSTTFNPISLFGLWDFKIDFISPMQWNEEEVRKMRDGHLEKEHIKH